MCLCADLIKTIHNPFEPAAARAKKYYLVSAAVPIIVFTIIGIKQFLANADGNCSDCLRSY